MARTFRLLDFFSSEGTQYSQQPPALTTETLVSASPADIKSCLFFLRLSEILQVSLVLLAPPYDILGCSSMCQCEREKMISPTSSLAMNAKTARV